MKDNPDYDANDPHVGLVHRIDKDTSGLLVIAKHRNAKTNLRGAFHPVLRFGGRYDARTGALCRADAPAGCDRMGFVSPGYSRRGHALRPQRHPDRGGHGRGAFEKNADEIMYPASTTKIMTAYIALQMGDMDNDVVTVSQNAIDLVPPTYQTIPPSAGEQVPLLDLISVMLIRSNYWTVYG